MKIDSLPAASVQDSGSKSRWAFAVATFFGVGYLKPAPGSWASAAAVLLWAAFYRFVHPSPQVVALALGCGIALTLVFGVPAATIAERQSGRHDPGFIVIDEIAGQWIALLFCPFDWRYALLAFLLFRVIDVTKPFPARQLERLPNGWGIVFDDVAAGLYALGMAYLARLWF